MVLGSIGVAMFATSIFSGYMYKKLRTPVVQTDEI
jgi:hypothetical protein